MMAANVQGDDSIYSSKSWFVFQSVRLAEKQAEKFDRNSTSRWNHKFLNDINHYRQQHKCRWFKWILCWKLNPPMINSSFKLSVRGTSNCKLPFKDVLLTTFVGQLGMASNQISKLNGTRKNSVSCYDAQIHQNGCHHPEIHGTNIKMAFSLLQIFLRLASQPNNLTC